MTTAPIDSSRTTQSPGWAHPEWCTRPHSDDGDDLNHWHSARVLATRDWEDDPAANTATIPPIVVDVALLEPEIGVVAPVDRMIFLDVPDIVQGRITPDLARTIAGALVEAARLAEQAA